MIVRTLSKFSPNNIFAGFIVAVVALPLCIAFAVASGANPLAGLVSGVAGGLVAAVLGSSRFQVSGPAAAFITILYALIAQHGFPVLLASTFVAGVVVLLVALLRLGKAMELIPHSVVVGFTTGIGVLILFSQLPVALGVAAEGGTALAKLAWTARHLREVRWYELAVAAVTLAGTLLYGRTPLKRFVPPALVALLIGVGSAKVLGAYWGVEPKTIGALYDISVSNVALDAGFLATALQHRHAVLMAGLTLGILIAVESLLSAKALDGMTKSRHDPRRELLGLAAANMLVPFLGGLPVSGVIVRGSANVMSGGTEKTAAVLHSVFLGLFVVALYPSIKQLPMAALAAVLMLTARRLIEVHEVKKILHIDRLEGALVLLTTLLTVVIDLTVSVPIGVGLMLVLAVRRMMQDRRLDVIEDEAHAVLAVRACVNFLTCASMKHELEAHLADERIRVLDLLHVPYLDATGAVTMAELAAAHPRIALWVADEAMGRKLTAAGVAAERVKQRGNRLVDLPEVFNALGAPGPLA